MPHIPVVGDAVEPGQLEVGRDLGAWGLVAGIDLIHDPLVAVAEEDGPTDALELPLDHGQRRIAAPSGRHQDADGEVRFIERILDWDGYVRLAFDELRLAGAPSP